MLQIRVIHRDRIPTFLQHIQSGKVTALAALNDWRLPGLPDVPTIKEGGIDHDVTRPGGAD